MSYRISKIAITDRFAHPNRSMNQFGLRVEMDCISRLMDNQIEFNFLYMKSPAERKSSDRLYYVDAIRLFWGCLRKIPLLPRKLLNFGLEYRWLDMSSYDHPVTRALISPF